MIEPLALPPFLSHLIMAFQQAQTRRHRTTEATVVIDHPPLNQNVDGLALGRDDLTQEDYDDFNESERGGGSLLSSSRSSSSSDGVLVLFPRSTVDSDGSSSPRGGGGQGQIRRLNSYHDGTESTSSSGDVDGDFSLLPSHDGNGVFIRLERGERGGIESLRGGTTSNSQSSTSNSRTRRYSISSGSLFNSEDEGEGEGGGWALTEAALSSISNHHHHSTRAILVRRNNNQDDDNDDNENDEEDLNVDSDLEIRKSLTALSAGIGHHGRRRRMTASRSPSNRNNHRLPLLPVVGSSSVQRSLSPQSSNIKRRHGLLEATASATKSHNNKRTFEQIEQEEKLRAERMKLVLQQRLKENEIKRAKNHLLFIGKFSLNSLSLSPHVIQSGAMGLLFLDDFAIKLMDIDPTTLPLLANTTSTTTTNDFTPTPSRASSPPPSPPPPASTSNFSTIASQEISHSSFDSIGQSYSHYLYTNKEEEEEDEDEDDGNLTETEHETTTRRKESTSSLLITKRGEEEEGWVHSTCPPIFAPRSRSPPRPRQSLDSSVSTSLPTSTSNLCPPPPQSVPIPLPSASNRITSLHQHQHNNATLSHEEKILLSTTTTTGTGNGGTTSSSLPAWGGELDSSFELALHVWKKFLKRLTLTTTTARTNSHSSPTPTTTTTPTNFLSPEIAGTGGSEGKLWGIESSESLRGGGGSGSELGVY